MRTLHVHNYYRYRGGEDVMFERICSLLREQGHLVATYERQSGEIGGISTKVRAFASSAYSLSAKRDINAILSDSKPDIVHIHNLYPLVSPSVIEACAERDVPVVLRCPNYRLECPAGVLMRQGKICTLCSGGNEYWCALTNCRGSILESVAIATRNMLARMGGLFRHVSVFVPPSTFVKSRLIAAGFPEDRIRVVPNVVPVPKFCADASKGQYVAFAGRLSAEKGIETLLEAAKRVPNIPVRIAGEGPLDGALRAVAPSNVIFVGRLAGDALAAFYANARMAIVPSRWYETFGLVAAEAMSYGVPVIATNMAGLAEIVDDGTTGFLFHAGDAATLAARIERLWNSPVLCRSMGAASRRKVEREYSEQTYYQRLMNVYGYALKLDRAPIPNGKVAKSA